MSRPIQSVVGATLALVGGWLAWINLSKPTWDGWIFWLPITFLAPQYECALLVVGTDK
jgi:hypothetical protein